MQYLCKFSKKVFSYNEDVCILFKKHKRELTNYLTVCKFGLRSQMKRVFTNKNSCFRLSNEDCKFQLNGEVEWKNGRWQPYITYDYKPDEILKTMFMGIQIPPRLLGLLCMYYAKKTHHKKVMRFLLDENNTSILENTSITLFMQIYGVRKRKRKNRISTVEIFLTLIKKIKIANKIL